MSYQVICLNDDQYYALATTREFPTRGAADVYADTVSPARYPLVASTEDAADQQYLDGSGMALDDYLNGGI